MTVGGSKEGLRLGCTSLPLALLSKVPSKNFSGYSSSRGAFLDKHRIFIAWASAMGGCWPASANKQMHCHCSFLVLSIIWPVPIGVPQPSHLCRKTLFSFQQPNWAFWALLIESVLLSNLQFMNYILGPQICIFGHSLNFHDLSPLSLHEYILKSRYIYYEPPSFIQILKLGCHL